LASSFDTGGWFARDAATLRRVGSALLTPPSSPSSSPAFFQPRPRWLVARDAFALASPAAARALYEPLASRIAAVSEVLGGPPQEVDLAPLPREDEEQEEEEDGASSSSSSWRADLSSLAGWADVFRVAQAREIWREHGAWVEEVRAQQRSKTSPFGPGIDDRLRMAASITEADAQRAARARGRVRRRLDALLGTDGVLVLPSAPGPAVKVATPPEQLDAWRRRLLSLTCVAGLGGLPQVSLPVGKAVAEDEDKEEGAPLLPVGLSLIGPRGSDEALLEIAERLMAVLTDEGSPGGGGSS
jgi:amidase